MTNNAPTGIAVLDSITHASADNHAGMVVVAASHAGLIAAQMGRTCQAHALIFNNAGVGYQDAGISGLAFLEAQGIPAAAADHQSCRIGDGDDLLAAGIIAQENIAARGAGVRKGMSVAEAAHRFRELPPRSLAPYQVELAEHARVLQAGGRRRIIALDSASMLLPEHAEDIVVTGSHGGLVGGRNKNASPVRGPVYAVFFNDAGGGKDGAGYGRLGPLNEMGIVAGCVDYRTAPIGDAGLCYEKGILSAVNPAVEDVGLKPGQPLTEALPPLCETP